SLHDTGQAGLFHGQSFPAGHAATDLALWLAQEKAHTSYAIQWEEGFEPYSLVDVQRLPSFDLRFDQFFRHDKHSLYAEMAASGWHFRVLRDGFLVDQPHDKTGPPLSEEDHAVRVHANGLMRRKFRELRCRQLQSVYGTLEDWSASAVCPCPAHSAGDAAQPPFICQEVSVDNEDWREPGEPPEIEPAWVLPSEDLDAFAARGGGKLLLPWPCGAALRGQVDPGRLLGGRVLLGPGDPLLLRISLERRPSSATLAYAVCLEGKTALDTPIRLPGFLVKVRGVSMSACFRLKRAGMGTYCVSSQEEEADLRKQRLQSRFWQLLPGPSENASGSWHQLTQQATLQGPSLHSKAWLDGRLVWEGRVTQGRQGCEAEDGVAEVQLVVSASEPKEEAAVALGPLRLFATSFGSDG
ncbi:large1, partial [Symbiodinium microadriaticum]